MTQIHFSKRIPEAFPGQASALLSGTSFMSINLECLRARWGERPSMEGKGLVQVWFWHPGEAASRVLRIDFGGSLLAAQPADEWLSVVRPGEVEQLPVSLELDERPAALLGLQALYRRHSETLTSPEDIRSYRRLLAENEPFPELLQVERDVVEWLVFQFEAGQSLLLERDDQIGCFKLFLNDEARLRALRAEVEHPEWGRLEVVEVGLR